MELGYGKRPDMSAVRKGGNTMRRTLEKDDVFYTAAVIEMAARKTHNRLSDIVRQVKLPYIAHVMQYANIDHCLPMNQVVTELIEDNHVQNGEFDAEGCCRYRVPSSKDIGKVYARLVTDLERDPTQYPKTLCSVLSSEIPQQNPLTIYLLVRPSALLLDI